jgi:hypothetical protein
MSTLLPRWLSSPLLHARELKTSSRAVESSMHAATCQLWLHGIPRTAASNSFLDHLIWKLSLLARKARGEYRIQSYKAVFSRAELIVSYLSPLSKVKAALLLRLLPRSIDWRTNTHINRPEPNPSPVHRALCRGRVLSVHLLGSPTVFSFAASSKQSKRIHQSLGLFLFPQILFKFQSCATE